METIFIDSCYRYDTLFVRSKAIWDGLPIFGTGGIFKAENRR